MSYRKYAKDYKSRLVSADDGRRMKETFVYVGPTFRAEVTDRKKTLLLLLVGTIGAAVLFLAAGLWDSACAHSIFTALPFVVILAPIGFLFVGIYRCLKAKEPMKREEADHSWRRVSGMSMTLFVMGCIASVMTIGFILFTKNGGFAEIVFLVCLLGITAIGGLLRFWLGRNVKVVEIVEIADTSEDE